MPNDQKLIVYFERNDGYRERVPLRECALADAISAIERVFHISEGLYTKADIYRGDELVEKVQNHACVRLESVSVQ